MTRFARAKGSKASNEKIPEEATSWLEMKKAVLSKSSPPDNPKEPVVRVNENTKSKTATEWASLDNDTVEEYFTLIRKHHQEKNDENSNEVKSKKKANKVNANSSNKNSKNIITQKTNNSHINNEEDCSSVNKNVDDSQPKNSDQVKKNKGKKRKQNGELSEEPLKKKKSLVNKTETESTLETEKGTKVKKIKNKQKNSNNQVQNHNNTQNQNKKNNSNVAVSNDIKNKKEGMAAKHKTKKLHAINKNNETATRNQKFHGKNKMSNNEKQKGNKQFDKSNNNTFKQNKNFSNKKNKFNNEKQSTVEELIVNGEKIQIVKFQGFNVTLEDAERLKKLRNDMFKEGIPRNKLEAAIKLERRRAEKSLSRLKKAVCFHCRGYGHVLSQCPSLTESENTGTGICYKCGSTEHSSAECKVVRGSSFQFAECFICKEQGHIARQCPDNPRGLYPHGGACKECGDVTHLRKDCPKVATKKEEDLITVGVRNDRNLESLEEDHATKKTPQAKTPVRKSVVKF